MRGHEEVTRFSHAMLRELDANDYKGGWPGRGARTHLRDLDYHVAKLRAAVGAEEIVRVLEYAADVANHAMFLADEAGALDPSVVEHRRVEPHYVRPGARVRLRLVARHPRYLYKVLGLGRLASDRRL